MWDAWQMDGEVCGDTKTTLRAWTDPDASGDRCIRWNCQLELPRDHLESAQKTRRIARREELFGIGASTPSLPNCFGVDSALPRLLGGRSTVLYLTS